MEAIVESSDMPLAGVNIAATGVSSSEENTIREYLRALGGTYQTNLVNRTTYLIVKRVGSEKYSAARKLGIPTITIRWLADCFAARQRISTRDYQAGPFYGLTICCTQLPVSERHELEACVVRHGGIFMKDLDSEKVSHLIAVRPEGEKYALARSFKITVVTPQWSKDCMAQERWLAEQPYMLANQAVGAGGKGLKAEQGSATGADARASKEESKVKNLAVATKKYDALKQKKDEDAAAAVAARLLADNNRALAAIAAAAAKARKEEEDAKIRWEELPHPGDVPTSRRQSLSHEVLYFAGFSAPQLDYLVTLIACGGANRAHFLTNSVTKIFLGDNATDAVVTEAVRHACGAPCVRVRWLIDSLVPGHLARCDAFRAQKRADAEAAEKRRLQEEEAAAAAAAAAAKAQLRNRVDENAPPNVSSFDRELSAGTHRGQEAGAVSLRSYEDSADALARELLMSPTSAKARQAQSARSLLRRRSTGILRTGAGRAGVIGAGAGSSGAAAGYGGLDGAGAMRALRKSDSYAAPSSSSGAAAGAFDGTTNSGVWPNAKGHANENRKRLLPQPTVVDWHVESSEPQIGRDVYGDVEEAEEEEEGGLGYPVKQRRDGPVHGRDVDKSEPSQWVVWD